MNDESKSEANQSDANTESKSEQLIGCLVIGAIVLFVLYRMWVGLGDAVERGASDAIREMLQNK